MKDWKLKKEKLVLVISKKENVKEGEKLAAKGIQVKLLMKFE